LERVFDISLIHPPILILVTLGPAGVRVASARQVRRSDGRRVFSLLSHKQSFAEADSVAEEGSVKEASASRLIFGGEGWLGRQIDENFLAEPVGPRRPRRSCGVNGEFCTAILKATTSKKRLKIFRSVRVEGDGVF